VREGGGEGVGRACGCDSGVGSGGGALGRWGEDVCRVGGEDGCWGGWRVSVGVGGDLRLGLGLRGYGCAGVFERRRSR